MVYPQRSVGNFSVPLLEYLAQIQSPRRIGDRRVLAGSR